MGCVGSWLEASRPTAEPPTRRRARQTSESGPEPDRPDQPLGASSARLATCSRCRGAFRETSKTVAQGS